MALIQSSLYVLLGSLCILALISPCWERSPPPCLYVTVRDFSFCVSEEVCLHRKGYAQNKTLLVFKVPLASNFVSVDWPQEEVWSKCRKGVLG